MDSQTHFFSDSVDLGEDSNLYVGSSGEGTEYGSDFQHFPLFVGKDAKDSAVEWQTSTGRKRQTPELDIWDGLSHDAEFQTEIEQQPLFGTPVPRAEKHDEAAVEDEVGDEYGSRPSTRRASSSKSVSVMTTKSTSAATDLTAPDGPEPPKKKRSRKVAKQDGIVTPEEEKKRTKFLERNRVAASKCREKKKSFIASLNEKKADLETQHAHLFAEYDRLREEANELRQHLISHAKCNDPNIDCWLNSEARRFVQIQQSSQAQDQLFDHTFAAATAIFGGGTLASQPPTHHSTHSRNPSTASTYASGVPLDVLSVVGGEDRRASIPYSHGQYTAWPAEGHDNSPYHTASPLETSPTDVVFPALASPQMKREPGINYDHMPDSLFAPDQSSFSIT